MNRVSVATFDELGPAQQLQERLERAGITARIHDESRIERFWFMSKPLAAIHVEVDQHHFVESRRLLERWDQEDGAPHAALRCPECHSSRIEYPQMTRKFFTPSLVLILMALRLVRRKFYCHDCHYTWPTVQRVPPRLDVLNWPQDSRF